MRSHGFIVYLLLSSLLLSSCAFTPVTQTNTSVRAPSSEAEAIMLPSVSDDVDKLKILMAIAKEIPEIFSDAARFDINLFEILDDQEKLQKLLNENSNFQRLWNSKKYSDFTFKVKSKNNDQVETKQITEAAVSNWKDQIKLYLKNNPRIDLEKEIAERLNKSGKMTSAGLMNGLILNLPKELQGKAREYQKNKDDEGLLSHLKNNLADSLPNFKAEGIAANPKRDDLLKLYKELITSENSIGPLIDAYAFTTLKNQGLADFYKRIDSLTRQDLENLNDPDYQNKIFEKLLNQNQAKTPPAYLKYLKTYTNQTQVLNSSVKIEYQVSIKEQNPNIAIFRGCTGGDCSSQFSFPYPNDPNERVFFIYDENGHLKGYVSGTMTEVENNEKAFYVITISGNRVNSVDTEVILQGLYQQKETLGVKHIVLPRADKIAGLLNFGPIKAVFEKAVSNKPNISLNYNAPEIRAQIEEFKSENNTASYDHMKSNAEVVIYHPVKSEELSLQIELKTNALDSKKIRTPNKFESTALLEFMLAMGSSDRQDILEKVIENGYDTEEKQDAATRLNKIIFKESLPTNQLNDEINSIAKTLEIDSKRLEEKKTQWFMNAFLNAPDAQSPENLSRNLERLIWDLKNNNPPIAKNTLVEKFIRNLYQHKDYQKVLDALEKKILTNDTFLNELAWNDIRFSLIADYMNKLGDSNDINQNKKARVLYTRLISQKDGTFWFSFNKFTSKKFIKDIMNNALEELKTAKDQTQALRELGIIASRTLEAKWTEDMTDIMHEIIQAFRKCTDYTLFTDAMNDLSESLGNQTMDVHSNIMELLKVSQEQKNIIVFRSAVSAFAKRPVNANSIKEYNEIVSATAAFKDMASYERIIDSNYFKNVVMKDKIMLTNFIQTLTSLNTSRPYLTMLRYFLSFDNISQSEYKEFLSLILEGVYKVNDADKLHTFYKQLLLMTVSVEVKTTTVFEILKSARKNESTNMIGQLKFLIKYLEEDEDLDARFPKDLRNQMKKLVAEQSWASFDKEMAAYEKKSPIAPKAGGNCQQLMDNFL